MKAFGSFSLRYGIVAPGTARVTPEHSLNSKNATFEGTVFLDRFDRVFGARRNKSALARTHEGGDADPVHFDQENKYVLHLESNPVLCSA